MTDAVRRWLLVGSLLGFGGAMVVALVPLPTVATHVGAYSELLARITQETGRGVNVVNVVLFDLRPSDTLGEALALFVASAGLQVALRNIGDERRRAVPRATASDRAVLPTSDAIRTFTLGLVATTLAFAVFITVHGHLTVGGGLQGGALVATALALLFLAGRYRAQRSIASEPLLDAGEAISIGGYVVVGLAGLAVGAAFLENILPLGRPGDLFSAGTIPILSTLVALEAAAAVLLLISEVQEEPLEMEGRP